LKDYLRLKNGCWVLAAGKRRFGSNFEASFWLSRQNFRAKTLAKPFLGACCFPFPLSHEARMLNPETTLLRCRCAKDAAKISARPCDTDGGHY
jgi:hypothetical protein